MAAFERAAALPALHRRAPGQRALVWLRRTTLLSLAACSACSHFSPYYRHGLARQVEAVDDGAIDHRLLLIGDAGEPEENEPALRLAAAQVRALPDRTTVLYLGDNIYERGMPAPVEPERTAADTASQVAQDLLSGVFASRVEAERRLDAQIDVVRGSGARVVLIPGNHDWDQFEIGGWDRILNLEYYVRHVAGFTGLDVRLLPAGGCPGPNTVLLGEHAALIVIDTQWWLETRQDGKPTRDNNPTRCPYTVEKDVREALRKAIDDAARQGRQVVVAGHHPLETHGSHGGFEDIRTHLFPFRIIGSYVPFFLRWLPLPGFGTLIVELRSCCSPSAQDFASGRNRHMRKSVLLPMLQAEKAGHPPLVYASGHDHSLQVFASPHGPNYTLVSGMGSSSHTSAVGSGANTLFAHALATQPGIMQIDFLRNGRARLSVREWRDDTPFGSEVFSLYLDDAPTGRARVARR